MLAPLSLAELLSQHLVGENPEEREDVVGPRREFDRELPLLLGIGAIDQVPWKSLAMNAGTCFIRVE